MALGGGALLVAGAVAELAYRRQVVDFYRPELLGYNGPAELADAASGATMLCMGDSFTAGALSYPTFLRALQDDARVVNAGIPGTGVIQAAMIAPRRLARFKPDVLVYQIYVGNDLFDVRYPVNWKDAGIVRSAYWAIARHARIVAFVNYRLGQIREGAKGELHGVSRAAISDVLAEAGAVSPAARSEAEVFNPELYAERERVYLRAEPALIENQVMLRPARRRDFERFLGGLSEILTRCPEDCRVLLVFVPHPSQVHPRYLERTERLGAEFSDAFRRAGAAPYPFVVETAAFLRERGMAGVEIVDPLAEFQRRETGGQPLYYVHDSHLNAVGQAVLARVVLARLDAQR